MVRVILCLWCVVAALPMRAFGAENSAPGEATATSVIDTPEAALALLRSMSRPIPVTDAERFEAMLREAMAADPDDMRWPAALAMLSRSRNGIADAEALARRVVETEPEFADGWFALGVVLSNPADKSAASDPIQRSRLAIASIDRALKFDPMHPGALGMATEYYLSVPASAGGDIQRATDLSDRMMTIESIRCRGAELRARIAMGNKDWAGVDSWFAKGIEWAPDPATLRELHRQHALLYLTFAKDYKRAIAIALPFTKPGEPDAHRFSFVVGQAAYRLGDCDMAIEQYTRVVESGDPPSVALIEMAECQEKRGDIAGAIATLETFARNFKGNAREEQMLLNLNRLRAVLRARNEAQKTQGATAPPSPGAPGGGTQ